MTRTWLSVVGVVLLSIQVCGAASRVATPDAEYLAQFNKVLLPALILQMEKHHIKAKLTFSVMFDRHGRQTFLSVGSTPRDRAAEQVATRVVRSLKFPPVPSRLMGDADAIKIDTSIRPKPK
jgi:hypothetical protein